MANTGLQPGSEPTSGRPGRINPVLIGALLIGAGLLLLLQQLGYFESASGLIWTSLFTLSGLAFLYVFLGQTHDRWWAAIPAFALLGLAGTMLVSSYFPESLDFLSGAIFLATFGIGFLAVYLVRRDFWWALIPAGVLMSVGAVAGLTDAGVVSDLASAGVLFLGLGLTFTLVAIAPGADGDMRWWAFIPASILYLVGVLLMLGKVQVLEQLNYVWPLALIGVGGWILWRTLGKRRLRR